MKGLSGRTGWRTDKEIVIMPKKSAKILTGKSEIMAYLDFSEPLFNKFLAKGLPVIIEDNRYYAHADNLDDFFKFISRKGMKNSGGLLREKVGKE